MTTYSLNEIQRALRAADWPEDSMATEEDLLRYEGRREAVEIVKDMLELPECESCGRGLAPGWECSGCGRVGS